jgi:phosphoheptose isomerase
MTTGLAHLARLRSALADFEQQVATVQDWGYELADRLGAGARLLAAGNGGSAAQAQHLTAELVGRYRDERRPLSAIALHAETSSLTAIANDYGAEEMFARQVSAHGRPGDVCLLLSTSGRSGNIVRAAERAREEGLTVWALTGPAPNELAAHAHEAVCVTGEDCAAIQEVHLTGLHILCEALDAALLRSRPALEVVG